MLGLLHIQLTSVWPGLQEAISSFAELPSSERDSGAGKTVEKDSGAGAWNCVARRLYWSALEPIITESMEQVLLPSQQRPDVVGELSVTFPIVWDGVMDVMFGSG